MPPNRVIVTRAGRLRVTLTWTARSVMSVWVDGHRLTGATRDGARPLTVRSSCCMKGPMPFDYERDDAQHRVVITFRGAFQASDGCAAIQRHHAEGVWTYGVLYDLRALTGHPTMADLRQFMTVDAPAPSAETRRRGPVAFVATDSDLYRNACSYAELGRGMVTIEVFRVRDEADRWLAAHTHP